MVRGGTDAKAALSFLIPLLISLGELAEAETLLGPSQPEDDALNLALHAVINAASGQGQASSEHAAAARERIPDDDVDRLLIAQRSALAAYMRGDNVEAIERARDARSLAQRLGSDRAQAGALTVEYAAVHAGAGDAERAWDLATALSHAARAGGDRSRRALGDVALYELAAERADLESAAVMARAFTAEPLANQYRERFTHYLADVLLLLLRSLDHEAAIGQLAAIERTTTARGERALCKALRSLCFAALDDVGAARREARQAIALTSRPPVGLNAGALRHHRLARALGIAARNLIGDAARGRRALDATFVRENPEVRAIVQAATTEGGHPPATVAGYVRVVRDAASRRASVARPDPLTATERNVLRLLAIGRSTDEISAMHACSKFTTRTHVRNAIAKLGARGRLDAVARARNLGLLGP